MTSDEMKQALIDLIEQDPDVIWAFFNRVETLFKNMSYEQKLNFMTLMFPRINWDLLLPALDQIDWLKVVGMLPRTAPQGKAESFFTRLDRMTGLKK